MDRSFHLLSHGVVGDILLHAEDEYFLLGTCGVWIGYGTALDMHTLPAALTTLQQCCCTSLAWQVYIFLLLLQLLRILDIVNVHTPDDGLAYINLHSVYDALVLAAV